MSIKTLLQSLPAKPGVALAILVGAAVMSYYYYERQAICNAHDAQREQLYQQAAARLNSRFAIKDITPFEWTDVIILTDNLEEGRGPECPFGSDWLDERLRLIAAGRLEVMVFFNKSGPWQGFRYIEFDNTRLTFVGTEKQNLSPDNAVFLVTGQPDTLTLSPASIIN